MQAVAGQVGATRYRIMMAFVAALTTSSLIAGAVLPLLRPGPLQTDYLKYAGTAVILLWAITLYNTWLSGPRRCFDVSETTSFELTEDWLSVSPGGSHKWQRHPTGNVAAVRVYKQSFEFGLLQHRRQQSEPQPVEGEEELRRDLASTLTCVSLLLGGKRTCSCAFLGAEILGQESVMPLSRAVWHERGGLRELFELADAAKGFRDRRFQAIAALPTWRLPVPALDLEAAQPAKGEDEPECSICLQVMVGGELVCQLPCGHKLHEPCAKEWLRVKPICPLCKDPLLEHASDRTTVSAGHSPPSSGPSSSHGLERL